MLSQLTISKTRNLDPALDYQALYKRGLKSVQDLSSSIWTDYNVHDPGVTTLELLCYALTDLSYRASLPVPDLLATESDNVKNMKAQFFTARQILPNRPLTVADYRKLLIDLKGVKNAWLRPASQTCFVNTSTGQMFASDPGQLNIKPVSLRGLYSVLIDYMDDVAEGDKPGICADAMKALKANRNLCDDFVRCDAVKPENFLLCCEVELAPDADVNKTLAEIFFQTGQCLAPPVNTYSLSEMLARTKPDGTSYTPADVFNGPKLERGFIDDDELAKADLLKEIHLSDIIAAIMEIDGVLAVGEIVLNPDTATQPLANKWVVPVDDGKKAVLDRNKSRVVLFKKNMPVVADSAKWHDKLDQQIAAATAKTETVREEDLDIPLGRFRMLDQYSSFQKHFPMIYGLGDFGFSSALPDDQKALPWQLKAYLLFFDQIMADFASQAASVRKLFSTDASSNQTYFYQPVEFKDVDKIYKGDPAARLKDIIEDPTAAKERRNRFLDHLIARFAEQFTDFANAMNSAFGVNSADLATLKCDFLNTYPSISSDRALAYDYTQPDSWDSENVSGLEKRLAKLLGIQNFARRDLLNSGEGMYLIENILLRPDPTQPTDPLLTACVDPNCKDCADLDPYSYRVHVILPAYSPRFLNMDFRRFVESTIRAEMPAHILPKICWINEADMKDLQTAYHDWIRLISGEDATQRPEKLTALRDRLTSLKNVYPSLESKLTPCAEDQPKFILNQTVLGS